MVVIIYCFIGSKDKASTGYYIDRHAEPPDITKQKTLLYIVKRVVIIYDNSSIEPYTNRGLGQQ